MSRFIVFIIIFVNIAFANSIVRVKINPKRVEPQKQFPLTASLDDCGLGLISPGKVEYLWEFENTDVGESSSASGNQITHKYLSTGRKYVTVKACVGSFQGNNCDGTLYETRSELWVQYVRREVRDLSSSDWNLFVDAMWKIKTMEESELRNQYGEYAISYDNLVVKHFTAAFNVSCDQGHIWEAFHIFHRAIGIQMENSIQSIYPSIALPYWDQNYDEETYAVPVLDSEIWSDNYFGGVGLPENDYIVINGKFGAELNNQGEYSGWNIASAEGILDDIYPRNPYNLLRSPLNSNSKLPFSRVTGDYQGFIIPYPSLRFQSLAQRANCQSSGNFSEYHYCQDAFSPFVSAHPAPHIFMGGAKSNINQSLSVEAYGIESAFSMYLYRNALGGSLYYSGLSICEQCTDINCDPACRCADSFTPEQLQYADLISAEFGFDVPAILDPEDPRNICEIGGIMGDLLDPATSPNDPIFFPFHTDLDRGLTEWLLNHQSLGIYGDYPEVVSECPGHGLHETLLGDSGWTGYDLKLSNDDTYNIPISELIERTSQPEFGTEQIASYRYQKYSAWGDIEEEPEDDYCDIIHYEYSTESFSTNTVSTENSYSTFSYSSFSNSISSLISSDSIFFNTISFSSPSFSSSTSSSSRISFGILISSIVFLIL